MAGVTVVGFPNDYILDLTRTSLPSLSQSLDVGFGPSSGSYSCPTCIFADADDHLLDYYGRPIDVNKLLDDKPTPTLPLKISFAGPLTSRLKPTPTPQATSTPQTTPEAVPPPEPTTADPTCSYLFRTAISRPGASKFGILLFWCQIIFGYIGHIVNTTSASTSHATKGQIWDVAWGFVCGIFGTLSVMATVELGLPRLNFWTSLLSKCRNLPRHVGHIVNAASASIPRATKQQICGITRGFMCGVIGTISVTARVKLFLPQLDFWKSHWTKGKTLDHLTSSQADAQLAMKADSLLEKFSGMVHGNTFDPNETMSSIQSNLAKFVSSEQARRAEWQVVEQQRLLEINAIQNKAILEKKKRQINQIANQAFKTLRKGHKDRLDNTYEQDVLATANIGPSFGPSLRHAEVEIRNRLRKFNVNEGQREELTEVFERILYSFTYAIAIEESRSGERNSRYLAIIDGQNGLIESLRLLHEHRENAFAEIEDLVKLLCNYDKYGQLIRCGGGEPWTQYSRTDDRFILSPLDEPTALSMKVSISSAGIHSHHDTLLDSDPYWQRFLDSIEKKRNEQQVRHASADSVLMEDEVEMNNSSSSHSGEEEQPHEHEVDGGNGNIDASEQNRPNDDMFPSVSALHGPHGAISQQHNDTGSLILRNLKDTEKKNGEAFLPGGRGNKPAFSSTRVSWLKWQIKYLKEGHGTPEDPYAKPYSDIVPLSASETLTGDAAIARAIYEEEWREDRILRFEQELREKECTNAIPGESPNPEADPNSEASASPEANAEDNAIIEDSANEGMGHGSVAESSTDAKSDNSNVSNEESQTQIGACTDASLQPHQAEPQATILSNTQKRNAERRRAKARKNVEAIVPNQ